ncbi:response regulator [Tunicatimonas pelagia]|uniref:response regulator n=1 Tax=Tunicatimonas pelagia TaxID=931531 RepID=UPI002666934F|nr:response regulator [Tunicatimonas pelagia]WKN40936.1 response regulator [Tunicatimonas pelagia]
MRVFIIDDNQIDLLISRKLLLKNSADTDVKEYSQAQAALSDITANPEDVPNIILLDLNMPTMDGWGFLDGLKKAGVQSGFKVYVLTSSLDDRDRTRAQNYQVVEGYLTKPLNDTVIQGILQ